MLASEEDGDPLDEVRFSLASDIVELVVLTADDAFLQTLREAVGDARRLWHVPSADKVSDLLLAGGVGILVLDVHALNEIASVFIAQIKRQFPDLVVVAAGNRESETALAGLISAGAVYRFIHKPMSPGRAKLFADAAVRKFEEQRRRAAETPPPKRVSRSNRGLLVGGALGGLGLVALAGWALHRNAPIDPDSPRDAPAPPAAPSSAGLSARAENPLREERLDEASIGIEAARKAGVESGRVASSSAQLAKSREQVKSAQLQSPAGAEPSAGDRTTPLPNEAPAQDAAGQDAEALASARRQAETDAREQLLNNANERLQQDHLIEPDKDNAKYYLVTLRGLDPENAGLTRALQDLGTRLVAKARGALALDELDAARSWLDEAVSIGFASGESSLAQRDLEAAVAKQKFLANIASANDLVLRKSVKPVYPPKAELNKAEGWVELDFTVAETGEVKDIAVHGASAPGVFDDAAIGALSQWRYQPVVRDAKPAAQRARIRIRFVLAK